MKKKILIMRHAKSSWDEPGLRDFDRPLNNRGKRDAPRMGKFLLEKNLIPDQIFSSTAARAKATILSAAAEFDLNDGDIDWTEDLYHGGPESYLNAVRAASNSSSIVMTVGHNPMTEDFIDNLAGKIVSKKIATATIACFETDAQEWRDIQAENCRLLWIKSPKDLDG